MRTRPAFNYDPKKLPRELRPFYIGATEADISSMLKELGLGKLEDLFSHIPASLKFDHNFYACEALQYEDLAQHVFEISQMNNIKPCFIGDALVPYQTAKIVPHVCGVRGLTTAYTPYQPERSQGTLQSLWIYQSALSELTGFEAINASLYDRATALYEALNCALRLTEKNTVVLASTLHPQDLEVIHTHARHTQMKIVILPMDEKRGILDLEKAKKLFNENKDCAALAFPQINCFGNLESVDELTNLAEQFNVKSIAVIDPALLAQLKPPSEFGNKGTSMLVAEGQCLSIGPNFGGPGLGIFGIRYNEQDKISIRSTAGRYVGKSKDETGKNCKALILSTREQHIRREKATSNICSNQSFVATIAGAALLEKGAAGLKTAAQKAQSQARLLVSQLLNFSGVSLRFPESTFFNEVTLTLSINAQVFIEKAAALGVQVGVAVGSRLSPKSDNEILISFSDWQSESDGEKLIQVFEKVFGPAQKKNISLSDVPAHFLRSQELNLPHFAVSELEKYYTQLGEQNISPDDSLYPLGSCTMKYNPYINDYAAGLQGFTDVHPEAPISDVQGCLKILYETQEIFKNITGLPAVTTQPLAGAQGELVGLKMFQAYFEHKGEIRDILLIPRSAHGTNPATATMAGFETKMVEGKKFGIITVEANEKGMMDLPQVKNLLQEYGTRVAGIMVTNPNTSGIFEENFHEVAQLIHEVGGLVYMDGANMNAIAGWVDLGKLGVDAVHNNLHKTWTIPHGGGGPGDAIVAVSEKLKDFLPGHQVTFDGKIYALEKPKHSMGSIHRHFGNFAHKVRCYTYLKALGSEGIRKMAAVAVLSSRYLQKKLVNHFPILPHGTENIPRMHEFILTLAPETFEKIEKSGTKKALTIARVGKLFLDFGVHSPTVAFPEVFGLMIEPTESFSKNELDRFTQIVFSIHQLVNETPEVLQTVPHFTPIDRVDEVEANKNPVLSEKISSTLPAIIANRLSPQKMAGLSVDELYQKIISAHQNKKRAV